jgi:hypothetical protein
MTMPEFQLSGANNVAFKRCSEFEQGYILAMFFADTPEDEEWDFDDLHESAFKKIKDDCAAFCADQKTLDFIDGDEGHAGRDLWYTRQGHGCGFWDGDWSDEAGKYLTARAKSLGECWPYKGDDGQIYF